MSLIVNQTNNIPVFVENQVLRADDLNALAAALQAQLQLNRLFNIGSGKIDGLAISVESGANAITLAEGLAISSDGYEITVGSPCTFSFVKQLSDGFSCDPPAEMSSACATRYRLLAEATKGGYELSETLPVDATTGTPLPDWKPLEEVFEQGIPEDAYCLLLIWCVSVTQRTGCFSDCEARGANRVQEIRAVLAPREIYNDIFEPDSTTDNGTAEININIDKSLEICRFGFQRKGNIKKLDLCRIKDWGDMHLSFWKVCEEALVRIKNVYLDAYQDYYVKAYPDDPDNIPQALFETQLDAYLKQLIEVYRPKAGGGECLDVQYLYSYFHELVLAYREFAIVADGLTVIPNIDQEEGENAETGPARCDFPGHVSLGWPGGCNGSPGRQPTSRVRRDERELRARCLFRRMAELIRPERLSLPVAPTQAPGETVRLTPDIRREPFLSSRAVPYYYAWNAQSAAEALKWHCDANPYCLTDRYTPLNKNPLLYRLEPYDFYRIEGHYGGNVDLVIDRIEEIRSCLNVAFDLRTVCLGDPRLPTGFQAEDLEDWYQNTRTDILCKLEEYSLVEGGNTDNIMRLKTFFRDYGELATYPPPEFVPEEGKDCCSFKVVMGDDYPANLPNIYGAAVGDTQEYSGPGDFRPLLDLETEQNIRDVVERYHRRRYETALQQHFSCFAHEHPGLEHLGGVPKGGTLVLVCKEQPETRTQIVVADFCLPYLCCGDNIVVRNEIRQFTAKIELSVTELCWTEDAQDRAEITVQVSPSGGILRVIDVNSGNELLSVPVSGNSRVIGAGDFGEAVPDFENGVATLNFLYGLEGAGEVNALLAVYEEPRLDCALAVEEGFEKTAIFDDANCRLAGYEVTLQFAAAIDLSGMRELSLRYGTAADLRTIAIKGEGVQPDASWLEEGKLAQVIFSTETDLAEVALVATNGPCRSECVIPLSLCPDDAKFEFYERFELGKTDPSEVGDILGIGNEQKIISIKENGDTGFLAFKIVDTGQRLEVVWTNSADGTEVPLPNSFIYGRPGQQGDCAENARYYLIYNRKAAQDYLASLASVPGAQLPFTPDQLKEVEPGAYPIPAEFRLDYYAEWGNCLSEKPLSTLSLRIGAEKSGDGSNDSDLSDDDTPTEDDDVNDVTGSSTTTALSAAAGNLLNRRTTRYRDTLLKLRDTDNSIANSNGFKRTNLFLDTRDPNLIDKAYMTALEATLKTRESTTAEREPLYTTVATVLTQAYLDKIVASGDLAGAALTDGLQSLDKAGIDVKKIKRGWKATELEKEIDKDRVEAVNKQIKA